HFSIYLVNALVFNGKAVVERRGFRPKIFDDFLTGLRFEGTCSLLIRHGMVRKRNPKNYPNHSVDYPTP
ncbi:hypothetical protein, partial [Microcystis sp. LSC13-02]|uniref:hypothetical protein n=1 Tax=Microcystis sp. LSC13-02 TaxID=1895004 RepID=UPI00257BE971